MNNFNLHTPTRILFGKDAIADLRAQIPADARVLITYGGGSVKKPACWIRFTAPGRTERARVRRYRA